MGSILLWFIIAVLLVLWLLSFLVMHLGGILHLFLVLALILIVVTIARRERGRPRVHRRL
ncbi:MAG: lmo0937 family membrane protein [Actinobacteria bacterium]|nr:lmo0937 family membrane protein [Actinomycetota bacterium]